MATGSILTLAAFSATPSPPPTGFFEMYILGTTIYLQDSSGTTYAFGTTTAISQLTGDVSAIGPGSAVATVNSVGGASAANIASATGSVLNATSVATPSTLVTRDSSGNFSANVITASIIGNVTGNVSGSAASFTGSLAGDVTGTQGATLIASTVVTGKLLTGYTVGSNTPLAATDSILGAFEKLQGQINAIGASDVTAVTATSPLFSSGGATPNITIQQATTSQNGYLSAADWNTFNSKQNALTTTNDLYVARTGNDVVGAGTLNNPFHTVGYALTQVSSPSSTNIWIIHISGRCDAETGNILIPPYTFLVGSGGGDVASYLRLPGGNYIGLGTGWTSNGRAGIQNLYLGGGTSVNLDFAAYGGSAGSNFIFDNVSVTGTFNHTGRGVNGGDFVVTSNGTTIFGNTTLTGDECQFNNTIFYGSVTMATSGVIPMDAAFVGGNVQGALSITQSGSATATIQSSNVSYNSTFTTVGTLTATVDDSLPPGYTLSVGTTRINSKNAASLAYIPTTPGNWSPAPSLVSTALDQLASEVHTITPPFYAEYHVLGSYAGATSTGSYSQPFTTIQAAVNAAQTYGAANSAIFLHGTGTTENVTINNYSFNLLITNFSGTVIDNQVFVLTGNVTISGLSTRIRLKDFKIQYPGGTQPDLIDSSQGRNYFSNIGFEGGGGIQYTGSWARWHEYTDCTISGPVSIGGTPTNTPMISAWRTRGGGNYTVNSSGVALALYDNFNIGNVVQTSGSVTIDGGRGFTAGSTISSTSNNGSDLLTIINVSLETTGSSFAQINKTGTCPYILSNVLRNEVGDTLAGTRLVQGSSAADEKYVPTTPANWPVAPTSVLQALDELASANALVPFTGDTGSGGTQGLVPAPGAGTKAAGDFLKADGTWAYVDQSKPIYNPFSFIAITPWTGSTASKFENIATYTGIDGHKQYAAIVAGGGAGTLFIWDITDPAIPVLCSFTILSGAYNLSIAQISGAIYAFVPSSGASTLYTINITNPYALTTTSSLTISGSPGSLYNCVYSNGYVYIATQNKGLTVVDVGGGLAGGTITAPIQSYQEGGTTNKSGGVAVFGNIVYTTNYQTTFPATIRYLKTWELAAGGGTLAVPFLANTYTISGGPIGTSTKPLGIALSPSGNTAYVTDGNQNIIDIIDVTSPTAPNYLNYITPSYTLADNSLGVAIVTATPAGNYLYVPSGSNATNGGCVDLFDVTVPASPVKVKSIYTGVANDVFGGIALNSGYIFGADYGVSGGYSGISVFTQAFLNPTFGLPVTSNIQVEQLTANTALYANSSQQLASSTTTATELSYVHGVTSPIQTQINSITGSGITSLNGDVVATGPGAATATIQPNVVTNAKLAQAPANTIKGNNTGSTANEADLTPTQVASMLSPYFDSSGAAATVQTNLNNYINPTSMQFAWLYQDPHYYTQMIYTGSNVTEIIYWDSPSMVTQLFTKNMTYTGGLVTQVVLTRISDSATLTKTIAYSGSQVSSVTRS